MNKFVKALKAISLIIKKPYLLNHIIEDEGVWKDYVNKQYAMPKGLPVVDLTALFPGFDETVNPYAYLDGATLPVDIALLKALASKYRVKDYFEIGTWRGESVANVASVADNCTSLNLPDIEMLELGLSEDYVNMHRFFSESISNVKHITGNSHTFDFSSYCRKFDMVFVDGDHHYNGVLKDTKTAFELLKNENGIIVWHDYAMEPESIRWSVMAGIMDACPKEKRKNIYQISNTLCAVYINENIATSQLKINEKPTHWFEINIKGISK